jgi:hypothetical protein
VIGLHAAAAASAGTLGAGATATAASPPVAGAAGADAASPPDITGLSPNNGPEARASGWRSGGCATRLTGRGGPQSGETAVTIRGDHLGRSPTDVVQVLIAGVDCTHGLTWMSSHKLMATTRAGIGPPPRRRHADVHLHLRIHARARTHGRRG